MKTQETQIGRRFVIFALPFAVAVVSISERAKAQSTSGDGAVYEFPNDKTVASIRVPDAWNPNSHEDGVDGASPDRRTFFDISILRGADRTKELQRILLYFKDTSRHPPDLASRTESARQIKDVATGQLTYALGRNGVGGSLVIDFATLRNGELLIVQQWGALGAESPNVRAMARIMATLNWK
ncbi:MAG: hypothetical protein ACKVON_12470 [Beijerinckiaceae bacterium]